MNKKVVLYIFVSSLLSVFFLAFSNSKVNNAPREVYRVYLKGKSLGLIKSKKDLEDYIDKEQDSIKKKYKVDKVYIPEDLDIEKEITYENKTLSTKQIYDKIKDTSPFTIDGYTTTIKGLTKKNSEGKEVKTKDNIIYTLKKSVIKDAITSTAKSFVTSERYKDYENDTQKEIKDTGTIIENIYIKNNITIRKNHIPVDKTIYEDSAELTKYLLFGTTKEQEKYTVKEGDTIEDVAFSNKISTEEFLIANTKFKDANSLLFPGQVVTLGIMHPQFDLVEEDHTVSDMEVNYETETKYDDTKSNTYSQVEQAGVKGLNRVTQKIQKVNGETMSIVTVNTEQLKAPVKEIVIKGTKTPYGYGSYYGAGYGDVPSTKGEWGWPATCTSISSPFGYRWGTLHDGTDIAGCGYGSNIFAAQAGTVVKVANKWDNGNYIVINHNNGYYTMYAHLSGFNTSEGAQVSKGQVIGTMGMTGWATGVHVHFSVWVGGFPYYGGRPINPMSLY